MLVEPLYRDQSLARDKRRKNKISFCNFLPTLDNIWHVLFMTSRSFLGENICNIFNRGPYIPESISTAVVSGKFAAISTASELGTW